MLLCWKNPIDSTILDCDSRGRGKVVSARCCCKARSLERSSVPCQLVKRQYGWGRHKAGCHQHLALQTATEKKLGNISWCTRGIKGERGPGFLRNRDPREEREAWNKGGDTKSAPATTHAFERASEWEGFLGFSQLFALQKGEAK